MFFYNNLRDAKYLDIFQNMILNIFFQKPRLPESPGAAGGFFSSNRGFGQGKQTTGSTRLAQGEPVRPPTCGAVASSPQRPAESVRNRKFRNKTETLKRPEGHSHTPKQAGAPALGWKPYGFEIENAERDGCWER